MLRRPPKDGMPEGREENDHRDVIMNVPIVLAAFGTTTSARQSYTYLDAHIRAAFPGTRSSLGLFFSYGAGL